MTYRDVFISHASEDKDAIARPLVEQLRVLTVSVWFDEYELMLGDSLRTTIGDGLRHSRVGVVILSPSFFGKRWPQWELDGLHARQIAGEPNIILPVWHDVDVDDVRSYSAPLADVVAAKSSEGVEAIATRIVRVLERLAAGDAPERALAAGRPSIGESEIPDSFGGVKRPRASIAGGVSHDRPSDASPSGAAPSGAQAMPAGRRRRAWTVAAGVALTAVAVGLTLALVDRPSSNGGGSGLALKSGPEGCVSSDYTGGACATARAMDGPHAIASSADGKNVYVTAKRSSSLVTFDRDPDSGSLTPQTGAAGCFARAVAASGCTRLKPLAGAESVTVSPDGRSVYVASVQSSALVMLDRDVDSGRLTPRPGRTGCLARDAGACAPARAMNHADGVAVSRDNRNVYVAAYRSDAVAIFDRDPRSGALEQKAGRAGCVAARPRGSCAQAKRLTGPEAVTVSPDGRNVYVATDVGDAVMVFDRDHSGALRLKRGQNACVSVDGTNGDCAIAPGVGVGDSANSVAVSPDGRNVYVAGDAGVVAILDRDANGALKAKPGVAGCMSRTGNGGRCTRARALLDERSSVTVSPDGDSVYVVSYEPGGLAVFDRDDRGALRLRPGHEGCISEKGSGGGCAKARKLAGASGVVASPDGRNVYVASYDKDAVTALDRVEARR